MRYFICFLLLSICLNSDIGMVVHSVGLKSDKFQSPKISDIIDMFQNSKLLILSSIWFDNWRILKCINFKESPVLKKRPIFYRCIWKICSHPLPKKKEEIAKLSLARKYEILLPTLVDVLDWNEFWINQILK